MNLRDQARWLWPIGLIMAIAVVCAGYILNKQRLESPLAERYVLHLAFQEVNGVTPGVGAPVTVAGVTVGQIDDVTLRDGRGVLSVRMDPAELPRVHADATAALIPNTPLKDMQIRLQPGSASSRPLPDGATIAVRSTTSPVNFDELLHALDADTRDWVQTLAADLGVGTKGRTRDLRALLRSLGPTAAQMRRVTSLLAERRRQIPQLVGDLRTIGEASARSDRDLRQAVEAGDATLGALAGAEAPLRETLDELAPTLRAARSTLERTPAFAGALEDALDATQPSLAALPRTLRESPDAVRGVVPLPPKELTAFVDATAPLAEPVRPAARDLGRAAPALERAFAVLTRTSDALAHQGADDARSYLFWMAWFAHNVNSALSTQDAHGPVLRGYAMFSCASPAPAATQQAFEAVLGTQSFCPGGLP